jgi:hypothetical protein
MISTWLRRHPQLGRFALAFAISWGAVVMALRTNPVRTDRGAFPAVDRAMESQNGSRP